MDPIFLIEWRILMLSNSSRIRNSSGEPQAKFGLILQRISPKINFIRPAYGLKRIQNWRKREKNYPRIQLHLTPTFKIHFSRQVRMIFFFLSPFFHFSLFLQQTPPPHVLRLCACHVGEKTFNALQMKISSTRKDLIARYSIILSFILLFEIKILPIFLSTTFPS